MTPIRWGDGIYRAVTGLFGKDGRSSPVRSALSLVLALLVLTSLSYLAFQKLFPTLTGSQYHYRPLSELKLNTPDQDKYFSGSHEVTPVTNPIETLLPTANPRVLVKVNNAHPDLPNTGGFDTTVKASDSGLIALATPNSQVKAGLYQLQSTDPATGKITSNQTVAWGVLAFNPDYAIYPVGAKAKLAMAVLDDRGKVVCDADMSLEITRPDGQKDILSTGNNQILVNEACFVYGQTEDPDYLANYQPTQIGDYQVTLTAQLGSGVRTLHDKFSVAKNDKFYVGRVGPTRTYPPVSYPYTLNFQPHVSGHYQVTESVPASFDVSNTTASVATKDGRQTLIWQFDARANHKVTLAFTFKTPNISPFLFEFGPIQVIQPDGTVWSENRTWQIASDNACSSNGTGGGNSNAAASWQSCGGTTPQPTDSITVLSGDTITMAAALTVTNIVINTGGIFTNNASPFTLTLTNTTGTLFSNSGTFTPGTSITVTMNPNASITTTSGVITFFDLNFTPTIATSGKTYTMGAGAITINGNWAVTGTAASNALALTVVMGANITVDPAKTLTIGPASLTNTAKLQTTASNYTLTAGKIVVTTLGILDGTGSTSIIALTATSGTLFTNPTTTTTFVQGTTDVQVKSASGTPTLLSAATTFFKLTIDSAATVVNMGAFVPTFGNVASTQLYIKTGVFNASGATITGPGGTNGTFKIDGGASFCLGGTTASTSATCNSGITDTTARPMPVFSVYTFATTSTVINLADAAETVSAVPVYGNLIINPKVTAARAYTIGAAACAGITIHGNLTVQPSTGAFALTATQSCGITLDANDTMFLQVTASATLTWSTSASNFAISTGFLSLLTNATLTANASTISLTGTSGTLFTRTSAAAGVFTQGTSTVQVTSASGSPILNNFATTFHKLTINNAGVHVAAGAVVTLDGVSTSSFNVTAGTFDDGGFQMVFAINTSASVTVSNGATLQLGSATTATTIPTVVTTFTFGATSTTVYQAGVAQNVGRTSLTLTYGHLTFTPLSGTPVFSMLAIATVAGNLTVNAGYLDEAGFQITGSANTFTLAANTKFCLAAATATCPTTGTTATSATATTMPVFTTYTFDSTSEVHYQTSNTTASTVSALGGNHYGKVYVDPTMTGIQPVTVSAGGTTINVDTLFQVLPRKGTTARLLTVTLAGPIVLPATGTLAMDCGNSTANATFDTSAASSFGVTTGFIDLQNTNACAINFNANGSLIILNGVSLAALLNHTSGGTFNAGTSTVRVDSPGLGSNTGVIIPTPTTFHILTVNVPSTATIKTNAQITLDGVSSSAFNVSSGTFSDNGFQVIFAANTSASVTVSNGATLKIGGSSGTTTIPTVVTTFTFGATSTVSFTSALAQSISRAGLTLTYGNLRIEPVSGTPTKRMLATATVAGDLTVTAGTLDDQDFQITGPGAGSGTFTLGSTAKFCLSSGATACTTSATSATTMPVFQAYNFDAASTVEYVANANQTVSGTPAYGILQLVPVIATAATTRTYTLGGAMTIHGNFDIKPTAANTTDVLTVNAGGNITLDNTDTLTIQPGATNNPAANLFLRASGVDYNLTAGFIVLDSLGTTNGKLAATDSGAVAGAAIVTLTGTSGTLFTLGAHGTFTQSKSTVAVTASSSAPALLSAATTFNGLTINAPGSIVSAGAAITMSNADTSNKLYIQSGILDDGGFQIAGTTNGTMVMDSAGVLQLGSQNTATVFPANYTNGIITLNTASTVQYQSSTAQTVSVVPAYGNLIVTSQALNGSFTDAFASGTATINGDFTLSGTATGGVSNTFGITMNGAVNVGSSKTTHITSTLKTTTTLDANGAHNLTTGSLNIDCNNSGFIAGTGTTVTVSGNYNACGNLTAQTSNFLFSGSAQQTLDGGGMTGSGAFYDLTITNASGSDASDNELTGFSASVIFNTDLGSTHTFTAITAHTRIQYNDASTYTFININWNGQATGTRLYFRDSVATAGHTWLLKVTGTQTVSNVNVSRSDASVSGGSTIAAGNGTDFDAGNNTNWSFGLTISGNIYQSGSESVQNSTSVTVAVSVNNAVPTTLAGQTGSYTFTGVSANAGNVLVVYISGHASLNANSFTVTDGLTNISNLHLYIDNTAIGNNNAGSTTNANVCAQVTYPPSGDNTFSCAGTVPTYTGSELHLYGAYAPGNAVNAPKVHIFTGSTYTGGSEFLGLSGSGSGAARPFYLDGGTFTANSNTVRIMSAANSEIDLGATYNNLQLCGQNGVVLTLGTATSQTLTVNGDLTGGCGSTVTVTAATYDPAINLAGSFAISSPSVWTKGAAGIFTFKPTGTKTWTDGDTTKQDMGAVQLANGSSTPKINLGSSVKATSVNITTTGATHELNANGSNTLTLTGSGTPFIIGGTFTYSTGTVSYASATTSTIRALTGTGGTGGYYNLDIASGTATLGGITTVNNNLSITSGTLDVDNTSNYLLTITGSFSKSGTFTARAGTVKFNGNADISPLISGTFTGANSFFNLQLSPSLTANHIYTLGSGAVATTGDFSLLPTAAVLNQTLTVKMGADITVATGHQTLISAGDAKALSKLVLHPALLDYNLTTGSIVINFGTLDGTSSSSNITLTNTSGTLITQNGGTFIQGTTNVIVASASGTPTLLSFGPMTFHKVTINSTATKILSSDFGYTISFSNANAANGLTITAGVLDDNGWSITGSSNGTLSMAAGTTLELGDVSNGTTMPTFATYSLDTASLVKYQSAVAQTIASAPSYGNLQLSTVSGTPVKKPNGNLAVNGNLAIDASNTLDMDVTNNRSLSLKGNYANSGTFSARAGLVTLSGTASGKTLSGTMTGGSAFYDLTVNGSGGGWTLGAAAAISHDFAITNGAFSTSGTNYAVTIGNNLTGNAGTWALTMNGSTWTVSGNWDTSAVAADYGFIAVGTSTVVMDGSSTKTIKIGATNNYIPRFYNLNIAQAGGKTTQLLSDICVGHILTVGAGTYDLNTHTQYFNDSYADLLSIDPSATFGTGNGQLDFLISGTVHLPAFYYNTGFANESGTGNKVLLTGDVTFALNFYNGCCGRASEVDTGGFNLTVGLDFAFNDPLSIIDGNGSTINVGRSWINSSAGTFNAGTSTVVFNGGSGGNITSGGKSFKNVTINGTGTWTPQDALTATGDLTMTAGTLGGTQNVTVNGNAVGTAGAINLTGGTFNQAVAANKAFGTTASSANWTFYDLKFSATTGTPTVQTNSGGTGTVTVSDNLAVYALANPVNLYASGRTWILSGSIASPLTVSTASGATLVPETSTFRNTGNNGAGNTNIGQTNFAAPTCNYSNLEVNNAAETYVLPSSCTVNSNLTITAGTLDVTASNYNLTIGGNYANSGTFTAHSGTVTLNGSAAQTVSGTETGTSAFYDLTITNASGSDASDCELTGFAASVVFGNSATATHNLTFVTPSTRVQYHTGSTYTFANINWNGQASGSRLYFRNSAAAGSWLLNVSGTQTAVTYINVSRSDATSGSTIAVNRATSVNCGNNPNWAFNVAPNDPSVLTQKKTDDTVIATGSYTSETSVKFTATASDTDNPDTLYLCVEKDLLGTPFSNTEDACGSGVAYSGSPVPVTVTIAGLVNTSQYHWQARVKDAAGEYSGWISYGGNAESARDFGIDTGTLSTDIVDAAGTPVASPSITMGSASLSLLYQIVNGIFGSSSQKVRVSNTTINPNWSLTIAANGGPTTLWSAGTPKYDFNDPTGSAGDGGDADSAGGQLTMDVSGGTLGGTCSGTGVTKGSSAAFSEGVTNSITLLTAGGTSDTNCYWDLTDVSVSQTLPAQQTPSNYSIDMTLTITAY